MPRALLALTIAAWMATAGVRRGRAGRPPLPGHLGFEVGPNSPVTVGSQPQRDRGRATSTATTTSTSRPPNSAADTVTPVYGNGFGGFTPGAPLGAGDDPEAIVLADFDGDARLDIATANRAADTCRVLIQDAGGEFQRARADRERRRRSRRDRGRARSTTTPRPISSSRTAAPAAAGRSTSACCSTSATGFSPPEGAPSMPSHVRARRPARGLRRGRRARHLRHRGAFSASGWATARSARPRRSPSRRARAASRRATSTATAISTSSRRARRRPVDRTVVLLGNGGGGFHLQEDSLLAGGSRLLPRPRSRSAASTPTRTATCLATRRALRPRRAAQEIDGAARVFLGDDDGGLSSTSVDGPWTVGLGPDAVAVGDFDEDGRPDFVDGELVRTSVEHGVGPAQHHAVAGPAVPFGQRRASWGAARSTRSARLRR